MATQATDKGADGAYQAPERVHAAAAAGAGAEARAAARCEAGAGGGAAAQDGVEVERVLLPARAHHSLDAEADVSQDLAEKGAICAVHASRHHRRVSLAGEDG